MDDFREIAELTKKRRDEINGLYHFLENEEKNEFLEGLLKSSGLEYEKSALLAILRRLVDLKEENLVKELEKRGVKEEKITKIKRALYEEVRKFYKREHKEFIEEVKEKRLLNDFCQALIEGVHSVGLVIDDFEIVWAKGIIEKNNKMLKSSFTNLEDALKFLRQNKLYRVDRLGEVCERSYGVVVKIGSLWHFVPCARFFENEILRLEFAFEKVIEKLQVFAQSEEEFAYIEYFGKLKNAFYEKEDERVIAAWQEAEFTWIRVKSPLQVGHPLEYYEDQYTHAVALEWGIRLSDVSEFNGREFAQNIKKTFLGVCENIGIKNENLKKEVYENIDKTQLYICLPVIYYGAELKGLFSAQIVPNDEFVNSRAGRKIFAFLNFVYENSKTKPFMKIASEIFDKEFLTYGRDILFYNEKLWKKIYEISTIGHEYGHIFFIAKDSEKLMNQSGFFKNIEECKATCGGLVNFFYQEEEELKIPVFHELIKKAVGLVAWQKVEEVKAYYAEGLIHLCLLFQSGVLEFRQGNLKIDFSTQAYEAFRKLCLQTYHALAKHYALRLDAKEFLDIFCILENEVFLPKHNECREFVKFYYALYERIDNELDESGEFERYTRKNDKK